MRKFRFVALLVVFATLLAACAPATTVVPTKAPEPTKPAATAVPATAVPATKAPEPTKPPAPTNTTAPKEVKIAILAPLSGSAPTFGVMTRDGALMAIDEWNAKGGVLGAKIVPVVEDSQCLPDPAVNAANKVINQDKVKYIVGEVCSKASIPVSDIANKAKVIQISPTSTNPQVTVGTDGKTKDYIFRACFIDPFQGQVGAKFVFENLKLKKAFIMLDQANDYTKGLAEFFEASFKKLGGEIVGKESYTAKDTDFSAILSKVVAAKPDVIYLPDYYNIVNLVAKQAKEKGIKAPFVGGDGWDSADLDRKAADGGFFTNHYSPDATTPEVVNFVKAFGVKFKDDKGAAKVPDALAALAYDATNLLIQAMANAGTAEDTDKVRDALAKISFGGVSGKISFDAQHNPIKSAVILQVKDGKVTFNASVAP